MNDFQIGVRLGIVLPVYNDWASFRCLMADLSSTMLERGCKISIIAVDDCSTESAPSSLELTPPIADISIVQLKHNMGHQRAIAIGLSEISSRNDIDFVAVMDCDGEDRAEELGRLFDFTRENSNVAVLAQRTKRSESLGFKVFYRFYRFGFYLLTGQRIDFGNFCIIPFEYLERLVTRPDIWNNFPGTIIRARIPVEKIPTSRGFRYAGESRMNTISLVAHGLGVMSIFSETIFIRILFASILLLVATIIGVVAVIFVKEFSDLAIPGWATNAIGFLAMIGLQTIMMTVMMAFLLLNSRSAIQLSPSTLSGGYIREVLKFSGTQSKLETVT